MKRVIKFKVWDSISKKMYPWELIKNNPFEDFELEHYTLYQFIGITDKNGKDIYENDEVIMIDGFVGRHRQIVWYTECHGWGFKRLDDIENAAGKNLKGDIDLIQFHRVTDIEVIGHIFDSPTNEQAT